MLKNIYQKQCEALATFFFYPSIHLTQYESFCRCGLFWNLTHVNDKLPFGPLILIGCHTEEALKVNALSPTEFQYKIQSLFICWTLRAYESHTEVVVCRCCDNYVYLVVCMPVCIHMCLCFDTWEDEINLIHEVKIHVF